jgi:Cu2+-exporting ATPase
MNMSMTMDMDHGSGGISMLKMMEDSIKFRFIFSFLFTIPIVLYSDLGRNVLGINLPIPFNLTSAVLLFLLATPVVIYGGWMFIYGAYNSLKKRKLDMSVLIAVGISVAYIFSIIINLIDPEVESFYEASAMLVTFVLFGHWMEMRARRGTSDSMRALFELVPPQARILLNGKEKLIATAEVKVNDILIVKPGDKIPVDGIVIEGSTSIDESLVTGESIPVEKSINDQAIGGSINLSGTIKMRTSKIGSDTALGQIMDLVQKAQSSKAPGQRIADKFAGYLVIVAISVGSMTFLIWYLISTDLILSLTFAISTVVIACPDALGLATPTAVAVGTGLGAQHNVLIKDASTLEEVSNIDVVMFDKTGTLTIGKPVITDFFTVNDFNHEKSIEYMQALEAKSNHPLSLAIMNFAQENNLISNVKVESFKNISGKGIEGIIDGKPIFIGNLKAINEMHFDLSDLQEKITKLHSDGKTLLIMAVDKRVVSVAGAEDQIKTNSKYTVDYLHQMGLKVGMISGDNEKTAKKVADILGIDIVFAEVLPSEKADHVKSLQKQGYKVAMVCDGVNDAPALAQADIGIAIGAGTDVAIETAKIILMKSDPLDVVASIFLSKSTVTKMKQNLGWASIYNILAIPIAAGILYPFTNIALSPAFAALLMSLSSIFVATNAVLLKKVESKIVRLKQLKPVAI